MAYQGAIGLDPDAIRTENESFSPIPEIVFLIDILPVTGINRIRNGRKEIPNAFEREENLKKVAEIFNSINSPVIKRIEGTAPVDHIHNLITTQVDALIARYFCP